MSDIPRETERYTLRTRVSQPDKYSPTDEPTQNRKRRTVTEKSGKRGGRKNLAKRGDENGEEGTQVDFRKIRKKTDELFERRLEAYQAVQKESEEYKEFLKQFPIWSTYSGEKKRNLIREYEKRSDSFDVSIQSCLERRNEIYGKWKEDFIETQLKMIKKSEYELLDMLFRNHIRNLDYFIEATICMKFPTDVIRYYWNRKKISNRLEKAPRKRAYGAASVSIEESPTRRLSISPLARGSSSASQVVPTSRDHVHNRAKSAAQTSGSMDPDEPIYLDGSRSPVIPANMEDYDEPIEMNNSSIQAEESGSIILLDGPELDAIPIEQKPQAQLRNPDYPVEAKPVFQPEPLDQKPILAPSSRSHNRQEIAMITIKDEPEDEPRTAFRTIQNTIRQKSEDPKPVPIYRRPDKRMPESADLVLPNNGSTDWLRWTIDDCKEWGLGVANTEDERKYILATPLSGTALEMICTQTGAYKEAGMSYFLYCSVVMHLNKVVNKYHGY